MSGTPPLIDAFIEAWDQAEQADRARVAERLRSELGETSGAQLLDAKTRAAQLHLNPEVLSRMARERRVEGAMLIGGKWLFPADCTVAPACEERRSVMPARRAAGEPGAAAVAAIRGS